VFSVVFALQIVVIAKRERERERESLWTQDERKKKVIWRKYWGMRLEMGRSTEIYKCITAVIWPY
jgi:hypothetical protein